MKTDAPGLAPPDISGSSHAPVAFMAALMFLGAGCASQVSSPDALLSGVTPQVVCGAQRTTEVTLQGQGLTPLPVGTLTDSPAVELPKVRLQLRTRADGTAGPGSEIGVPDDPQAPRSHVRWLAPEKMSFDVYPGLASGQQDGPDLPAGLYDVTVVNPDGRQATLQGSLSIVPAPTLQQAVPSPLCDAQGDIALTLSGNGFVLLDGTLPTVSFTAPDGQAAASELTASAASDCTALPAPDGVTLSSCRTLTVRVPRAALPAGTYRVAVRNPKDTGCVTVEDVRIAVVPPPVVDQITSATICTAQADSTIVLRGANFLVLGTQGPQVLINQMPFASVASDCAPVPDARDAQLCTTLTVTVPRSALPVGKYPLLIKNPGPAACSTDMMLTIEAVPPPVLTTVKPGIICAGGGSLDLTGEGFRDNAVVTINGVPSAMVTVGADHSTATAIFSGVVLPPGGPYDVTLRNPDGCQSTLAMAERVTPGPSILFVDPPAIPSVVSTQVTVYGSGVTPPVKSVEISPAGKSTFTPLVIALDPAHPNRVLATVPAGLAAGSYDIRLTDQTTLCPAILTGAIKVVATATLTVTSATPGSGTTAADTAILVSGAGFVSTPRVYLNPTGNPTGSRAQALGGVTFQTATSLTGVVRAGLTAGLYDLLVVNHDGSYGIKASAFKVTDKNSPPPIITSVSPSSVVTGAATAAVISGSGFRSPTVTLACKDTAGADVAGGIASVSASTATTINVSLTGAGALCIVRVTNADGTFVDYSVIGVTGAALNLTGFKAGTAMTVARRGLGTSAGRPTPVARFVYAAGGDGGADNTPLSSVESAPTGLDGALGAWSVQAEALPAPRSFLSLVNLGRFLYAVGGFDGAKSARDVYRAELLNPLAAPQITDVDVKFNSTTGLGAGLYNYRVAAVLDGNAAAEPNNPGGQTLPGDFFPVQLPTIAGGKLQLVLLWSTVPNAVQYKIYRSPKANDPAGKELLLATVQAAAVPLQYIDDGSVTPAGAAPLPLGSTGKWRSIAALDTARAGAAVAVAQDPADGTRFYLYAAGGSSGTLAAPSPLSSVEFLPIVMQVNGNQGFTTWTAATSALGTARWLASGLPATSANNSTVPAGTTYLYVGSGSTTGITMLDGRLDVATVLAGGQLSAFSSPGPTGIKRPGYGGALVNNQVMGFGGFQAGTAVNNSDSARLNAGGATIGNFNSLGGGVLTVARALQGTAVESAFIYQIGGAGAGVGTALQSSEQTIW